MKDGVTQRGSTWSYVIRVADADGRTRPRWVGGFRTEEEAKGARDLARVAARRGIYVDRSNLKVCDYLDGWLTAHAVSLKPKSASGYRFIIDNCINPRIGRQKLQGLRPSRVSSLYSELLTTGSKSGGPLSARTVHGVHRVLHRAMADAVNDDRIPVSPVDRARAPRVVQVEHVDPWTPAELSDFLMTAAKHRLGVFYRVAAYTGARRGEVLALEWKDIDLDHGLITISKSTSVIGRVRVTGTPKGGRARTIGIDAGTITALRRHLERQTTELGVESTLVFTQADGSPVSPDTVTQLVPKLCTFAMVRRVRLHDLRHLHATWLLTAGQPVHEVARRLGHRDAVVTLSTYAHIVGGRDSVLADVFAEAAVSKSVSKSAGSLRAV